MNNPSLPQRRRRGSGEGGFASNCLQFGAKTDEVVPLLPSFCTWTHSQIKIAFAKGERIAASAFCRLEALRASKSGHRPDHGVRSRGSNAVPQPPRNDNDRFCPEKPPCPTQSFLVRRVKRDYIAFHQAFPSRRSLRFRRRQTRGLPVRLRRTGCSKSKVLNNHREGGFAANCLQFVAKTDEVVTCLSPLQTPICRLGTAVQPSLPM